MAQTLQNPLAIQEIRVQSLDQEDPLEKEVDRGAWWATVHGVAKSRIRLNG